MEKRERGGWGREGEERPGERVIERERVRGGKERGRMRESERDRPNCFTKGREREERGRERATELGGNDDDKHTGSVGGNERPQFMFVEKEVVTVCVFPSNRNPMLVFIRQK